MLKKVKIKKRKNEEGEKMLKIAVFASGRGSNLQAIIAAVKSGELPAEICLVISDREDAKALSRAEEAGIANKFIDPGRFQDQAEYEKALIAELNKAEIELIVLAGFMRILSPDFVGKYENKIINIHPSLLPAFQGLQAQKQALECGVRYSGCTVHFVDEGIDTGPIILQAVVEVREDDGVEELADRILKEEHRIYPRAIKLIAEDRVKIEQGRVFIEDDSKAVNNVNNPGPAAVPSPQR